MASASAVVAGPRRTPGARVRGGKACMQEEGGRQAGRRLRAERRGAHAPLSAAAAATLPRGGWHAGRRRSIRLPMIGTASSSSSVDRDSLACVRCSPSRAPHGPACRARACCCALARRAGACSTLWRGARERAREQVRVQGGCKAGRGAAMLWSKGSRR